MNSQAKSDTALASCMHCATPLMPGARVCPCCGENPLVDNGVADASWFVERAVNPPHDPVLEAMMAVAAAEPAMARSANVHFLQPVALVRVPSAEALSLPASVPARTGPLPPALILHRPVWIAVVAVSALGALTAVLLSASALAPQQLTQTRTGALQLSSAAFSQARDGTRNDDQGDVRVVAPASLEPPPQSPAQLGTPDRPEEDARTIATALGLAERPEPSPPAAAPRVVSPAVPAGAVPAKAELAGSCGETLAALALCRQP